MFKKLEKMSSEKDSKTPKWLDKALFEKALQSHFKADTIKVKEFSIQTSLGPIQHFGSDMYRSKVTYINTENEQNIQNIDCIIKTVPCKDGLIKDIVDNSSAFPIEMKMYGEVLPKMQSLLESIKDPTIFGPKLIYQNTDPVPVIILEDLCAKEYETMLKCVSYDQTLIVASKIAKFHACSLVLNENGVNLSELTDTVYATQKDGTSSLAENLWASGVSAAIKEIATWKDWKDISVKLEKFEKFFGERFRGIYEDRTEQRYAVLGHADFHMRNLMMRNDGSKDDEIIMIDFQDCFWTTPVIDIYYLLYTIASQDVREKKRLDIIRKYFSVFISTLEKLQYKSSIPRIFDLQIELDRCGVLELMLIMNFVPLQYIDRSNVDLEKLMENNDFGSVLKVAWENEEYKGHLKRVLNRLIATNVLD